MIKCTKCRTNYADNVKFCPNCGTKYVKPKPPKSKTTEDVTIKLIAVAIVGLLLGGITGSILADDSDVVSLQIIEIGDLKIIQKTLENEISTLELKLSDAELNLSNTESKFKLSEEKLAESNRLKADLESQITDHKLAISQLSTEKSNLETQLNTVENQKSVLESRITELNTQITNLGNENARNILLMSDLEDEKDSLEEDITVLNNQITLFENSISSKDSTISQLRDTISNYQEIINQDLFVIASTIDNYQTADDCVYWNMYLLVNDPELKRLLTTYAGYWVVDITATEAVDVKLYDNNGWWELDGFYTEHAFYIPHNPQTTNVALDNEEWRMKICSGNGNAFSFSWQVWFVY